VERLVEGREVKVVSIEREVIINIGVIEIVEMVGEIIDIEAEVEIIDQGKILNVLKKINIGDINTREVRVVKVALVHLAHPPQNHLLQKEDRRRKEIKRRKLKLDSNFFRLINHLIEKYILISKEEELVEWMRTLPNYFGMDFNG
jgi:hypothetical protein